MSLIPICNKVAYGHTSLERVTRKNDKYNAVVVFIMYIAISHVLYHLSQWMVTLKTGLIFRECTYSIRATIKGSQDKDKNRNRS